MEFDTKGEINPEFFWEKVGYKVCFLQWLTHLSFLSVFLMWWMLKLLYESRYQIVSLKVIDPFRKADLWTLSIGLSIWFAWLFINELFYPKLLRKVIVRSLIKRRLRYLKAQDKAAKEYLELKLWISRQGMKFSGENE